jgi:hypothetical protein
MSLALDVARARAPATEDSLKSEYLRALRLVERLHRLLLDVIKDEFDRLGLTAFRPCSFTTSAKAS